MIKLVFFVFFISTTVQANDWRGLSPGPLVFDYDQSSLQSIIGSKSKVTDIIQNYYNQVYGVGFLHIGHMADSGHGHFLKDESGAVVAILYHTREIPSRLSIEDQSILKEENRNWIQKVDTPYTVSNALPLIYESVHDYPGLPEALMIDGESKYESWELFLSHFTVHSTMLDPKKVGEVVEEDFDNSFRFVRVNCNELAPNTNNNLIEIQDHNLDRICLTVHVNIDSDKRDYIYDSRGPMLSNSSISH